MAEAPAGLKGDCELQKRWLQCGPYCSTRWGQAPRVPSETPEPCNAAPPAPPPNSPARLCLAASGSLRARTRRLPELVRDP